jgi:hypothetical protein
MVERKADQENREAEIKAFREEVTKPNQDKAKANRENLKA